MSNAEMNDDSAVRIPDQTIGTPFAYCIGAIERCLHRWRNPSVTIPKRADKYTVYHIQDVGAVDISSLSDTTTLVRWMADYPSERDMLRLQEQQLGIVPKPDQSLRERALIAVLGILPDTIPAEFRENLQDDVMLEVRPETASIAEAQRHLFHICDSEYDHRTRVLLNLQQCFERELSRGSLEEATSPNESILAGTTDTLPLAQSVPLDNEEYRAVKLFEETYEEEKLKGHVKTITDWLRRHDIHTSDRNFRIWRKKYSL